VSDAADIIGRPLSAMAEGVQPDAELRGMPQELWQKAVIGQRFRRQQAK